MNSILGSIVVANEDPVASIWAYRNTLAQQKQPLVQYGTAVGTGSVGTTVVTLPIAFSTITSYVITATMGDTPAAQMFATQLTNQTFTLGWSSAAAGTHNLMWIAVGI